MARVSKRELRRRIRVYIEGANESILQSTRDIKSRQFLIEKKLKELDILDGGNGHAHRNT